MGCSQYCLQLFWIRAFRSRHSVVLPSESVLCEGGARRFLEATVAAARAAQQGTLPAEERNALEELAKLHDKLTAGHEKMSLGLSLFSRGHHHIGLTPAGERMERHARFLLDAWERAYEDTALSERHQRRLVVAGVVWFVAIFGPYLRIFFSGITQRPVLQEKGPPRRAGVL